MESLIIKNTFIVGIEDDVSDEEYSPQGRRRSEPSVLASIQRDATFSAMLEGYPSPRTVGTEAAAEPADKNGFHLGGLSDDEEVVAALIESCAPQVYKSTCGNSETRSSSAGSGKFSRGSTRSGLSGGSTMSSLGGGSITGLAASPLPEDDPTMTTVVAKNIPPSYSREMLTSLLDSAGFWARYDFLYLPVNFGSMRSFGYAIINFASHGDALRFGRFFNGFCGLLDDTNGYKTGEVEWSGALQGLEKHVERYRDSPMMHKRVQDELKPMLFAGGQRVAFPPPTKVLKMPRRANRKTEDNGKSFLVSPGDLISSAMGLALTYTPLTPLSQSTRPTTIPDAAARAVRAITGVNSFVRLPDALPRSMPVVQGRPAPR